MQHHCRLCASSFFRVFVVQKNKLKAYLSYMKKIAILSLLFFAAKSIIAQQRIFLYPSDAKGIMIAGFDSLAPFIDYYPAKQSSSNKTAVLICPGGGYSHLSWTKEGTFPAQFCNEHGIDAFVLSYRLNNAKQEGHKFPAAYNDVTTAIRLIKSKSAEFGIDPEKLGVLGFSAGGHLASCAGTMLLDANPNSTNPLEKFSSKPAFLVLLYPVITMDTTFGHIGSRKMILGEHPNAALADSLSTEKRVTKNTPPTMLILADDDKTVPPMNSIVFYEALKKYNIKSSLHIYDHGGHGFGAAPTDPILNQWPTLALAWMAKLGFK